MKITNELKPYALHSKKGYWKKKSRWDLVTLGIISIIILGAYIGHVNAGGNGTPIETGGVGQSISMGDGVEREESQSGNCTEVAPGSYNCSTDKDALKKWQAFLDQEIEDHKVEAGKPTAILTKVCRKNGLTDSDCPKILYAMALQESGMGKWMEGDHGKSHGFFHILDIHGLPKSCVNDLFCSADWSLKRMIRLGFNENRDNGIRLHNGGLKNPLTLAYLQAVKKKMALWPNG